MPFPSALWLDLCITLRCNAACPNCIKLCNLEDITGLDYSDSDMTIGQIDEFIRQVEEIDTRRFAFTVTVTGGEPLLHPQIIEMMIKLNALKEQGYISDLAINTNGTLPPPEGLLGKRLTFSTPKENAAIHNTLFLHPADFGGRQLTYRDCHHYRKNTLVLNYLGYSLCCVGEAYARLFGYADLFLGEFPAELPIAGMDRVCRHCPFGDETKTPFERDRGRPVSLIYQQEAKKNRNGRRITKRFPERKVA